MIPSPTTKPASLWEVWNYLVNAGIDGLGIRASEAIDIQPSTGNAWQVQVTIAGQLQNHNWIVTRLTSTYLLIEPRYTSAYGLNPGDTIYHVTPTVNRADIMRSGLQPRTGGGTRTNRSYPPRIFFSMDINAAFEFVDYQAGPKNLNVIPTGVDVDRSGHSHRVNESDFDLLPPIER